MIKLKSLLLENKNIIVGVITTDDEIYSHKDAIDHGDVIIKVGNPIKGKQIKNKWRYNKLNKTVYWWSDWSKTDGELVQDHLKHRYHQDVVYQLLIDVADTVVYQKRYNDAHGLNEQDEDEVDINRLYYNESYLDDVAEKLGYNGDFNKLFWEWGVRSYPIVYHCTTKDNYEAIKKDGRLKTRSDTRGFTNRGIGSAIFATIYDEEVGSLQQSYGPIVLGINMSQMKQDGFTPYVSQEPEWEKAKKLAFVIGKLEKKDVEDARFVDSSDGVSEGTIIIHESIPIKYLTLIDDSVLNESDKDDFLKHHYTGHIASHAYDQYEKEGGLKWLGQKSKYPHLLSTQKHGNYIVEYRQTGEKLQYVKLDDKNDYIRDSNGKLVMMSDDEIDKEKLPKTDTLIVAFIGDIPVGFASNEFGAVGVWVEGPYQRLGIGSDLMVMHLKQRPSVLHGKGRIGQMTNAGINATRKVYDKFERLYGKDWFSKMRKINEIVEKNSYITIFQGQSVHNKGSRYYTTDKEWARQFTQSGLDSEIKLNKILFHVIYKNEPLPEATRIEDVYKIVEKAISLGFSAIWVDEGKGQPNSVYIINKSALK